jgi:hypothetical protein
MMDEKQSAYEAEVKRMTETYGPGAEMPKAPSSVRMGISGASTPIGRPPISARLEELANQVAMAGRELAEARDQYQQAALIREQTMKRFCSVADALMQAIHEHREGVPEGVPYQP